MVHSLLPTDLSSHPATLKRMRSDDADEAEEEELDIDSLTAISDGGKEVLEDVEEAEEVVVMQSMRKKRGKGNDGLQVRFSFMIPIQSHQRTRCSVQLYRNNSIPKN